LQRLKIYGGKLATQQHNTRREHMQTRGGGSGGGSSSRQLQQAAAWVTLILRSPPVSPHQHGVQRTSEHPKHTILGVSAPTGRGMPKSAVAPCVFDTLHRLPTVHRPPTTTKFRLLVCSNAFANTGWACGAGQMLAPLTKFLPKHDFVEKVEERGVLYGC
jgi:hypothetical protein